ncbi:hypothetical protein HKBW3S43_00121 [Candidatus Hakubella thermalkaliphila]|uniref:Uncharacterized protein n=1 Tax=Candidatus Hakubella thermalkaliphila TaxID=2754717 RepID=A0A6V8QAA2_9ACTN|nr:hypothetical protein [Candidatus Hakubella thermalkaliphila]GFP34328.1 hypothetical protein HKBW3S43_00121 [Candidatus Hakubella thermalkaliphila]GFP41712.1 hypothetical protein HKBW3C_00838 [Candidatus Hakubella thermalkaliphila]
MKTEPFLFRFKRECNSEFTYQLDYDKSISMLVVEEDGKKIPAINSNKVEGLGTKKADLEKGEDQKDRWM